MKRCVDVEYQHSAQRACHRVATRPLYLRTSASGTQIWAVPTKLSIIIHGISAKLLADSGEIQIP